MSTQKLKLTSAELAQAFQGEYREKFPPCLNTEDVATLLRLGTKTIDDWCAKGRFDGAYRKRGKHRLFWRDRVLQIVFNDKEWEACPTPKNES